MTSGSGGAYMGGGSVTVLEHICYVNGVNNQSTVGVLLPILDIREVNVKLSPPQFHSDDRLET